MNFGLRAILWGVGLLVATSGVSVSDGLDWEWRLPGYVPKPRVPADSSMSEVKFQLGRRLFYDVRLSVNETLSCSSCHQQSKAFADGRKVSIGATGELTPRNAPSLANVAWNPTYTWANPALVSLERQMEVPLFGEFPAEMGINDRNRAEILTRLRSDPGYPDQFRAAFPDSLDPVNFSNIIRAIATFERGIVSFDSKYDRYLQHRAVLSAAELRGKNLFFGEKGECHHCHGSFNFNDQVVYEGARVVETPFHNTGLYNIDRRGGYPYPNRGLFEITGVAQDMGAFRAPSLRNVAVTGPYMHDGSIATLRQVLDFYAEGGRVIKSGPNAGDGRASPYRDSLTVGIKLTSRDKEDIVAFLRTLTDPTLIKSTRYAAPHK